MIITSHHLLRHWLLLKGVYVMNLLASLCMGVRVCAHACMLVIKPALRYIRDNVILASEVLTIEGSSGRLLWDHLNCNRYDLGSKDGEKYGITATRPLSALIAFPFALPTNVLS